MSAKILVVDDEPDVVRYFTALLEENGYETASASDGLEALAKARSARPDLITLDITMPNESGVKVFRELREDPELREIPVVVVTGISHNFQQFISSRARVPPPEGFLEKPVVPDALLREVERLLSRGASGQAASPAEVS